MSEKIKVRALRAVTAHGLARGEEKDLPAADAEQLIAWRYVERVPAKKPKADKAEG